MRWTGNRQAACVRDSKGRFKTWIGGRRKSQLKKQQNNFQGIAIHIGKEYKRQRGRPAQVGAIVRKKKSDGSYHRGAFWYVRTPNGWRKFGSRKPTTSQIRRICTKSRKGR